MQKTTLRLCVHVGCGAATVQKWVTLPKPEKRETLAVFLAGEERNKVRLFGGVSCIGHGDTLYLMVFACSFLFD